MVIAYCQIGAFQKALFGAFDLSNLQMLKFTRAWIDLGGRSELAKPGRFLAMPGYRAAVDATRLLSIQTLTSAINQAVTLVDKR